MDKLKGIEHLKNSMTRMVSIPAEEWAAYEKHLAAHSFGKNAFLVRAGEVVSHFYFISQGLVRLFYTTEDGKEFNKHFAMEHQIAGSSFSFLNRSLCEFSVQALEDTETIVLPDLAVSKYFQTRHPCWERLARLNAEHVLFVKEAREKELLLD